MLKLNELESRRVLNDYNYLLLEKEEKEEEILDLDGEYNRISSGRKKKQLKRTLEHAKLSLENTQLEIDEIRNKYTNIVLF